MRFSPKLLLVEPQRELRRRGRFLLPGLFDGEHFFQFEHCGDGTRLSHGENSSGLFVALMPAGSFAEIEQGFSAMNKALKRRAEM
jgi:hypothetical protein